MALNDTLSIDIARRGTIHIPAKQADHGYDIICTILRNGENIVDASTDTATFRVGKPDNTIYYGDATVNADNTVTIHVDDEGQMLAVPGFVVVDVTLNDGNGVVKSTQNFVLDVQAAPGGEAIPSWSVFVELEELVESVQQFNNDAEAYAAGTRDGVPVDESDPAYHNNAAYYAGQMGTVVSDVNNLKSAFTANLIHDTASGSIANFPDGAALPVRDLSVGIQPVQAGSGDPSPDNVRPISGWTGATVTRTGNEPYQGETYTIDWTDEAGTVYGGTLDVTTGKLTVDREFHTYDENASFSIQRVDNNRALVLLRGAIAGLDNYTADYICDRFSTNTARTTDDTIGSYFYSGTFRIRTPESWGTTEGEIATALANNPVTFVYPLAEPVVYDLTPTEVTTLLGTNNVWADTGDTTVDYYADPTLYINRKIAAAVAAMS